MLTIPPGFTIERIAVVAGARELAITRSGDLFVGTNGRNVYVIARADSSNPAAPRVFVRFNDGPAAGVAVSNDALFVGTQFGVYAVSRTNGTSEQLARVRTSGESRDHVTTSVAWDGETLFASVGSSCDVCDPELDETRATIQRVDRVHHTLRPTARNIRNAIALTTDPDTKDLWAGVAGQDELPSGHPYEIFDDVTAHAQPVDYGWPNCYEDRKRVAAFTGSCASVAVPRAIFPAYTTPIGAAIYPQQPIGPHAFPAKYRGGAFVTLHGSWHGPAQGLRGFAAPRIAFVPVHADEPLRPVHWSDPSAQWEEFVGGFQVGDGGRRIARPTGVTVGPDGSLFFADDLAGGIYRIRPSAMR